MTMISSVATINREIFSIRTLRYVPTVFILVCRGGQLDFYARTIYADPRYLTKIFFHDDVPVEHREIVIKVPAWADIELLQMNFDGYAIHKEVSKGEVILSSLMNGSLIWQALLK